MSIGFDIDSLVIRRALVFENRGVRAGLWTSLHKDCDNVARFFEVGELSDSEALEMIELLTQIDLELDEYLVRIHKDKTDEERVRVRLESIARLNVSEGGES